MTPVQTERGERATESRASADARRFRTAARPGANVTILNREPVFEADPLAEVHRREALTKWALATADAAAVMVTIAAVLYWIGADVAQPGILLMAPIVVVIHKVAGMYDRDDLVLRRDTLDEVPTLLQLGGVFVLFVAAAGGKLLDLRFGPQQLVATWLLTTLAVATFRAAARWLARRSGPAERCLIIADAEHERVVRDKLMSRRGSVTVVGGLHLDAYGGNPITQVEDMRALVERLGLHRVVIAPSSRDTVDTVDLVRIAKAAGIRVSILPRILEAVGSAVEFESIDGMTMMGVRRFGLSRSSRAMKRVFDLVVGGTLFVLVLPIFAVLALAVRLDSPGPIFFLQTRIGRDGRPFRIWKFRSMVTDAEARKEELVDRNEVDGGMFKMAKDPRVTRVGRFLRRTSTDELPQILNVLTGEMSLVGPRPLVADEDELVVGLYRSRLHLTPGMTGPWQILGSTRVPLDEMVGIDYLYVANWSLWQDIKLLLRTVPHMLARRGM